MWPFHTGPESQDRIKQRANPYIIHWFIISMRLIFPREMCCHKVILSAGSKASKGHTFNTDRTSAQSSGFLSRVLSWAKIYFKMQSCSKQTCSFPNEGLIDDVERSFRLVGRTFLPNSHPKYGVHTQKANC
jgi:hypothetical protein